MSPATSWQEAQLGDHVDLLTGYPFKSKQFTDDSNDVLLLRGDNVSQGHLRWESAKRWSSTEYNAFSKFQLQRGDVILAMDRPWIAAGLKYAWIREQDIPSLLVQRVARLRGANGLLTDYVRCLVGSPAFTDHVQSIITGVNVPHISGRDIKAFRFLLPPQKVQERIFSIITAYDDLIENNTRRIAVLEEMSWRFYEEWFVHYVSKHQEDGAPPTGWRKGTLEDVIVLQRGFDLPVGSRQPGIFPVFAATGQHGSHVVAKVTGPGVLTGRSGSLGKVVYINEDFWPLNTSLWGKRFPLGSQLYAYFLLSSLDLESFNSGAAVPTLNRNDIHGLPVLLPPPEVVARFDAAVQPMFDLKFNLERKNDNLRTQRDLLLPKLLSGEIDMSTAEKTMEDAA